ncbi:hypothetical protein O181_056212 [Austropuccinia psidii MF-1]|uniref:Integrase catalytic domain-containing protein n=1 Tax=Austropuccinia psidii MF-1 TaxID=1389203 RepID=A0A9Q3EF92_9BASI|nr:hypothetical protein [Austropuccinia psidii MF-1]
MFTNESNFFNLKELSGGVQIRQEGVKIPIKGRGEVVKMSNKNKIVFKEALLVPDLPYSLISLSRIWKEKGDLERLQDNKFQVIKNKKNVFGGHIENGLLHVDFDYKKAFASEHELLGHSGRSSNCEACKIGKSTQIAFNGKTIRLYKPLEEISVDLMGPITPALLGGAKYILVVVDSNSCFSWVIMLKNKRDAKHELEKIISQAETALETQVKNIICDGGKEFVNSFMKDFCDSRGRQITFTTPYTPQHNGIAEWTNRTLMDKVRTLIIESGVPKELWEELTNTANFLRVRVSDSGKSPFEKLFNRKPNLSRIRKFGCPAFVTNNNYKRKLDKRAYKGILIGYEPTFGAYQILLEDTGKIICSHDVRFNEDELPLQMHKNQELTEQENTVEEEIEPISEEQEAPVLQESQEPICIRLRIPRNEESSEMVPVNEGANTRSKKNKPQWE